MAKLDLSQTIESVTKRAANASTILANGLQRVQDAINNLGSHLSTDAVGNAEAPAPLQGVNVKTAGELVHVTLTHNVPIDKNIHYFVEHDTDPNFSSPHVWPCHTGRGLMLNLPTLDDNGAAQTYYFRGYPQYQGSQPAKPVNFGGFTPSPVTLSGSTQLTLLPSTGSGTAAGNGQQGGWGFGKVNSRPAIGPKRNIPA